MRGHSDSGFSLTLSFGFVLFARCAYALIFVRLAIGAKVLSGHTHTDRHCLHNSFRFSALLIQNKEAGCGSAQVAD
jgi:hypothetical protein